MGFSRGTLAVILALSLVFIVACAQPAAAPTAPAATPTKPAAVSTPTAPPPAAATPQAKATQAPAAASPTKPPATSAPAGVSVADLANKAKGATEYSLTTKMTAGGQTISSKTYVKGTKTRSEATIGGQKAVTLLDVSTKVAYTLLADQKMAMKLDFSQAAASAENPGEKIGSLPSDSKFVGSETVDGKAAAVYEVPTPQGTAKMWIWTERGLPLKVETSTSQGKAVIEYTEYQIGPQPDSLFELPPGTQVVDLPTGIPGIQGTIPVPPKK